MMATGFVADAKPTWWAYLVEREMSALPYAPQIPSPTPNAEALLDTIRVLVEHGHADIAEVVDGWPSNATALGLYAFPFDDPFLYMINLVDSTHVIELLRAAKTQGRKSNILKFDYCYQIYAHIAKFDLLSKDIELLNKVFMEAALLVWAFQRAYNGKEQTRLAKLQILVGALIKRGADVHSDGHGLSGDATALSRIAEYNFGETEDADFLIFVVEWWFTILKNAGKDLAEFVQKESGLTDGWRSGFRPVKPSQLTTDYQNIHVCRIMKDQRIVSTVEIYQSKSNFQDFFWIYRCGCERTGGAGESTARSRGANVWVDSRIEQRRKLEEQQELKTVSEQQHVDLTSETSIPGAWID